MENLGLSCGIIPTVFIEGKGTLATLVKPCDSIGILWDKVSSELKENFMRLWMKNYKLECDNVSENYQYLNVLYDLDELGYYINQGVITKLDTFESALNKVHQLASLN
jgi:hypothetical protein